MARHRNGDEECQAEEQVRPRENVGDKAPTCDKTSKQGGCEGGSEVSTCDNDGLSQQHANVCHEQHQQRGERKTPLKALLGLLVGCAQLRVVFCRRLEHKYLPERSSDPEDGTKLKQRDH